MAGPIVTTGQAQEIVSGGGLQDEVVINFSGGTAGDPGNVNSTPYHLFRVSGLVAVKVYTFCENLLVGSGATISLGTPTLSTGLIASTTASAVHQFFNWIATPAADAADTATNFPIIVTEEDIILTVGTANITAGRLRFAAIWRPISKGATLIANPFATDLGNPSTSPSASTSPR